MTYQYQILFHDTIVGSLLILSAVAYKGKAKLRWHNLHSLYTKCANLSRLFSNVFVDNETFVALEIEAFSSASLVTCKVVMC